MSTGEQTQLKPHRSGFVYTFGILSFISGFFALVLLMSGCGETRKQEEVRMMHDHVVQHDHAVTDEGSAASHPDENAGDEKENRNAFLGRWIEIDGEEQIRFMESGAIAISGGEMAFRGKYLVPQKGITKVTLGGLGEIVGTITGKLSPAGDELVLVAEIDPNDATRYRRKSSPSTSALSGESRNSPEVLASIEKAIRKAVDKETGEITPADREKVIRLDLSNKDIVDVAPLADLKQLEFLNLNGNLISDLKPLAGLTKLTVLGLTDNRISDPTPIAGLTELRDLRLNGNRISDLNALARLTKMVLLQLDGNQITDLSALESLKKTRFIELQDNTNLTRAEIARLQAVLSQCTVNHNATQ